MSADKFAVTVDDRTLQSGDTLAHIEHGPMYIDSVRIGPHSKTVDLKSELHNVGLELSESELQDLWGEDLHIDPMEIQQPTVSFGGISVEELDIEVELKVTGEADFSSVERVAMHARDQTVRALQAERDDRRPEDCDGADAKVDWNAVIDGERDPPAMSDVEQKLDELNEGLLESYAAGFLKALEEFDIEADAEHVDALKQNEWIQEAHFYHWDGRTKPLEPWIREQAADQEGDE